MTQIYIHGLGQTSRSWDAVLTRISSDENTICPNLPELLDGKVARYPNLYAAFSELCDGLDGPLTLCGLSLGAVLALHYAVEHPKKVKSLILIGAQFKMPRKLLRFQNILFQCMPKSMFQQMGFGKRDFLELCKSMMQLDFTNSLSCIECPVLILCGEKDNANLPASRQLASLLPNASLQIIEGAGHEINTEAPEKVAAILDIHYQSIKI